MVVKPIIHMSTQQQKKRVDLGASLYRFTNHISRPTFSFFGNIILMGMKLEIMIALDASTFLFSFFGLLKTFIFFLPGWKPFSRRLCARCVPCS